jgi:NAD(P)-dependent dehydrogenase (short-subunit alcohol dehydrogenase family)
MKSLKDKKCLITGSASGIGRATAIAAAQEGAQVFLTDISAQALNTVAEEIRSAGGQVGMTRALDITDAEAVDTFARDIHAAHGSLDVLMNIAGIAIWGRIDELPLAQWRRVLDVNLMGPIHVMHAFLPAMIAAKKGGHLVNVSSAAGLFGLPWHAAYSASKFGLRGICEVARFDLARYRIGVSLVCPGGVRTGLVKTIVVHGVDTQNAEFARMRDHFVRLAIPPEKAASAILKGIRRNRYLVFTSADIWFGYWAQKVFPWGYEIFMRLANAQFHKVVKQARLPAAEVAR